MVNSFIDRIVCSSGSYEIGRNYPCPLMNQLVESMLTVCSRFAPNDWTCGIVNLKVRSLRDV